MRFLLKTVVGMLVWAALLYGVVQIGIASEHGGHAHGGISVCGPWGCGPPVAALVGWHGFWLLLVAPPIGLLIRTWPSPRLRTLGVAVTVVGVLTLIGIGLWETVALSGHRSYLVQRFLFSVVTLTDVPVMPVTLAGIALCLGARAKRLRGRRSLTPGVLGPATTNEENGNTGCLTTAST